MNRYEKIYEKIPSQEEIKEIASELSASQPLPWEDYYWGSKCIIDYDTENCDPDQIIKFLRKATRSGLSLKTNPECYEDAQKNLCVFYNRFKKYSQVINALGILIDNAEHPPAWALLDRLEAQIHTEQIYIYLKDPQALQTELDAADDGTRDNKERRANLLRDFYAAATGKIIEDKTLKPEAARFAELAEKYDLQFNEALHEFLTACGAEKLIRKQETTRAGRARTKGGVKQKPEGSKRNGKSGDNVFQLFPETKLGAQQEEVKKNESDEKLIAEQKAKIAEILKKLESSDTDKTLLQRQLHEALEQVKSLTEKASTLDEKLQREIDTNGNFQAEIAKLKDQNQELISLIEQAKQAVNAEDEQQRSIKTIQDVYGTVYYYLFDVALCEGVRWLKQKLPKISKDYMEDVVFRSLTPVMVKKANACGWSKLEDLDIAAMLRVFEVNLRKFPGFVPSKDEEDNIRDMQDIRNYWAHPNREVLNVKQASEDLYIIGEFLRLVGYPEEEIDVLQREADEIESFCSPQ